LRAVTVADISDGREHVVPVTTRKGEAGALVQVQAR
jgi:hypothetical protein